jgi:hypothetical protein
MPRRISPRMGAGQLRVRAATIIALLFSAMAASTCLDFSTSPGEILYLTFERLPYPSIVAGDTLRDSTGTAALLRANAINADGDIVATAPLRFYAIDDTTDVLDVDSTSGRVVASATNPRTVRIIASLSGLQSPPLALSITRSPDSLVIVVPADTISYSFTDTTRNYSDALTAAVIHHDSGTFFSPVSGWVVKYSLDSLGDTTRATIVDDQNRKLRNLSSGAFHIDTTGTDGTAARKVRIRPGLSIPSPLDSVEVVVEAKYKGLHIPGSPARIWVYVKPPGSP